MARISADETLRTIDQTKAYIGEQIAPRLRQLIEQAKRAYSHQAKSFLDARAQMVSRHRTARATFDNLQSARHASEDTARRARLRTGLKGLWDRLRGERSKQLKRNELEAAQAKLRDREERHQFITSQLKERRELQLKLHALKAGHQDRMHDLFKDIDRFTMPRDRDARAPQLDRAFNRKAETQPKPKRPRRLDLER